MAAPFERAFAEQAQLEQRGNVTASGALIPIQYRADEAMYILPAADHTRREREDVAAKLARVTEREGQRS